MMIGRMASPMRDEGWGERAGARPASVDAPIACAAARGRAAAQYEAGWGRRLPGSRVMSGRERSLRERR